MSIRIKYNMIPLFLVIYCTLLQSCFPNKEDPESSILNDDPIRRIVDPFHSICYDWRGAIIPCDFKQPYAEILFDKPIPNPRFIDNKDGTVTDKMTKLIWLKNAKCFGIMDWRSAIRAAKSLKEGDCGPNPTLVLADNSCAGDWRLPTMIELCTLIDYSRRDPALPHEHKFSVASDGYYWSATTLPNYSEVAWIVYIKTGTTCYEDVKNQAGYIWAVRSPRE